MEVPGAAGPSLKTEQTYVGWWLRAVVDRGMAFDYELKQLLNVYRSVCASCGETVSQEDAHTWSQQAAPPQVPPSGPGRKHRKVMLILFAGVAGLILISFLIISL